MIKGTGVDIVKLERIEKIVASKRDHFLGKLFTSTERNYIIEKNFHIGTIGGMFAAKEAVSKSLGTGFLNFWPCNIEILKNETGKPYVNLTGNALIRAQEMNIENIQISVSHTSEYAIAFCIAE